MIVDGPLVTASHDEPGAIAAGLSFHLRGQPPRRV